MSTEREGQLIKKSPNNSTYGGLPGGIKTVGEMDSNVNHLDRLEGRLNDEGM